MPKITIDDIVYNSEDLSEHGLSLLMSLQFTEQILIKTRKDIEATRHAMNVAINNIKKEVESTKENEN
jgi:hypothetical protein